MPNPDRFSGDEDTRIATIELTETYDIEVYDDGYKDGDVNFKKATNGTGCTLATAIADIRREVEDGDRVREIVESLSVGSVSASSSGNYEKTKIDYPAHFKCDDCGLTKPRSQNATLRRDGEDICDDCH